MNVLLISLHMQVVKRKIHKVILLEDLQPVTRDVCRTLRDRQCRYHVTPRCVRATVLAEESNEHYTNLTLRLLMSYIYIYIYIYIYMEHPFLMFLDHTQRRSTVGRTPLDE